jgi:hypothetical protein
MLNPMRDKKYSIPLGYELNTNTFESQLSELLRKLQDQHVLADTIIFDMSKLKHISIGGLISFLSLCGALKEKKIFEDTRDLKIELELPSTKVMDYLHWMQFFKISNIYGLIENSESLSEQDKEFFKIWKNKIRKYRTEIDPMKREQYKARIFPIRFIPPSAKITDFESECIRFVNDLIDVFEPVLEYDLNFPKELRRGFWESNRELFKNIYDHSKSWGIVAVQVLKNEVVFSYSDVGIGIKNSLQETIMSKYTLDKIDDCFAIKEAIKKGVSSKKIDFKNSCNLGLGLYIVTEYTKTTNGRMVIRSGECLYSIKGNPKKVKYFLGTQIHIALSKSNNW